MDPQAEAAARSLASGDPLGALQRIALRDDPLSLALRGVAMAQLGELARARDLLHRAARGFAPEQAVDRARCLVAQAEIALAARELGREPRALAGAVRTLEARGDHRNALHGRLLAARRLLLLGRLQEAEQALGACDVAGAPPVLIALYELLRAAVALHRMQAGAARQALTRARRAARRARIPALQAEVEHAGRVLAAPAARLVGSGASRTLQLDEVEALRASDQLVIDGCRRGISHAQRSVRLDRRPVLFALLGVLAEAHPQSAARDALIASAFGARRANDSHRARLRVEIGRLRAQLRGLAEIRATKGGFTLRPHAGRGVVVLAPPIDGADSALLALLADGEAWPTSALALALGASQRTVQRALTALQNAGQVHALGRGRARRWLARPIPEFTTALLLPSAWTAG